MASVVVCALLFRWILPILLLGASCIRINGFSFIYLCCFLIIPLFPNPTRKNFGPCGHTGNLQKAILGLSIIAILAQITFQIVLAAIPPYGHFLPNCTTYEQLAREIGLNRFDAVPAYTVVRYIVPDVVVFIISLSCVLCCKKLASSPVSRAESPQSPQRLLAVSDEPTTTDNIMPYVMAAMLLAAGIIQPSVISVIYFLTFLGLGTVWACHKAVRLRHRKAFACIRLILMVYSGIHVMVLYLYQSQIFQDVLPPHNLITRLLGLVGIFYTDCNHPQVLHIKQNVDWPLVSCPGVILLLYWLLATETRIYFTNSFVRVKDEGLASETSDSSPSSPNQGISWWNPTTWPEKASSERQSLIAGAQDRRNYNAITAIPEDGVPEEPVQPVSHESRDTEDNPDVQGTLGSIMMFLMRQSYIAALIIMMAWSITYHSWLTFVLLLWACLIWITPFARWFCMVSSPGLVLYAEFLLLVQYIYGLRLKDSELPIQDSTGTFDYAELGLKKWKYPCLHLGAQTLFTWVFWLTLRQHIREKKIKKRARDATHSGIPLTSLAHPFVQALRKMSSLDPSSSSSPPDDVDGMDARASDDAKALMIWVKSVLAKYWILLCCGAFLLVGLQNEVSVYQIGYMAIFLFILICYQISLATWRIVLRPLWWVMVIYSICILLLIYTYQFDNMPVYWHNATGLSDKWLHNLGLRQHTKASLLMELLTPTAFSIIIVIQLHFFHRPFMAMIDIRNARCDSNTSATARYQSANGVEDIHHDDAATNSTVDAAEGPTGEHKEPEGSPAKTGEHSSPPHGTHQKSVLVTCLIKVVQFYNEVTVLLWRLGELHMVKLVNFILICVVVYQVCAINAIIIILLGISMPSRMVQRALSYCFLIWSSLVILSKMIYQLRFVQADLFQHNCTDKSLPVPANISHFTNNALWVGFYKTDVISEDIKGYLFIVIAIVLQAVIKHHQKLYRLRRGLLDPEPGVLFPSASRKKADVSLIECLKYMVNKFFFHFGWEVSLLVVVYNMAVRCDVTSVIYAIWLGVFLALGRKNCAVVWPVYVGFLAFLLPLQYLLCLGWPPGLCLAYPWTRSLDPNLIHWLYLTDVTYPPDPRLLIGDFLQLLFACCQENVFSLERFSWSSEEPPQPSNTRRSSRHKTSTPDFMWNITWLDFTKLMMFQHLYWITLAVVYITVQSTISIFNIGFILWCFFFLWHGQALYLKPKKKLLRLWKTFICYNYFILLAKVCLQAVSCVWMQAVQNYTGCWPLQLLSMFCLRESGYQNQKAITDSECVAPDDTGLAMDCACVTFLLIQYRIFCSDYFRHVVRDHKEQSEMAYRGAELVNQHLRKQLDSKILEDKQKMDRIKRSVNKLVEKLSKLHPAGVEYAPQSHYEAIYSGDYYWFDSDSESDSEADSQSVSPIHDRTGSLSCSDDDETKSTKQDTEPRPSTSGRSASRNGRESISSNSSSGDYVNVPTPEPSTAIVEPEGLVNKVKRWLSWIYYYIAMVVDSVIKVLREISKDYRSIADKLKRERKEKRIEKLRRSRMSHLHPKPTHSETSDSDTAAETKHHSTKGATDEEYDCLSLVDLEETDAPSWKHSQMRVARFTVAFVYALLAHTDIICYMLMILNHMVYACLLSMPLPFLVFMWGMLSIPRPTKRFWITVITYTQVVIVIKYLFKFPFIEFNTCNGKDGGDKDDPLCYPRILGIERVTHTSAYDLLLLLALYFHRYSLKVHGLWRDKAVHADDTPVSPMSPNDEERLGFERHPSRASTIATETSQDHDGETLWNKIVRSVRAFLHRIYDPETGSGAVDVYAMMFACQFIIFIIILFSWSAFSSPEPQRQAQFVKIVEENVVPKTFLYMLLTQFILIIFDRCFYLRKYVFAKLFYLLFLVVGFHIFMFIIVPYVTKKPFYKNIPAIFMYIFMCMYFGLSAYQIRCGYPTRILGNFLTKSYTLTSGVLFQGFQAIPFVLELRSVLDWACTDTTLSLYHWLKMDDIYANIYVLKCYRESEKTWFQARGQKYWILSKCTLGGLLILLLVLVIWFPLLLMSYINSVYTSNPPQDATFTLSIGGYQPLFRVSAQEQFLQQLNDSQIEKIKQRNPGKGYDKQQIDSFLRDYRERGTVELVKITGNSSSIWQISPPSRELMMLDLLGDKNVTMRFKYEFTREPKTALVQETISGQTLIPLDSTTRRQFAYMLNGTGGQEIVIRDMFPSFVNVPASGSATPITALFNASYVTCGIRMRMSGPSVEWWELTQKSPKPLFEESVLEMIAFNDLVPPLHFSFFASTGIIGLYVGFVWLVGKFVRLFFTSISYRIMFDEMPNVDKVLKLCLDIFMVRESKSFELEEDLFAKLMFLYRSPETLIKWTKYKRH